MFWVNAHADPPALLFTYVFKAEQKTKESGKEGLLLIYVSVLLCVHAYMCVSVMHLWVQAHTLWHRCGGERATFRSQLSPSTVFWIGGRTLPPFLLFHHAPQVSWPMSVCLHGCPVSIPSDCKSAGVPIAHYCIWLFTWISGIWTWIIRLMW